MGATAGKLAVPTRIPGNLLAVGMSQVSVRQSDLTCRFLLGVFRIPGHGVSSNGIGPFGYGIIEQDFQRCVQSCVQIQQCTVGLNSYYDEEYSRLSVVCVGQDLLGFRMIRIPIVQTANDQCITQGLLARRLEALKLHSLRGFGGTGGCAALL